MNEIIFTLSLDEAKSLLHLLAELPSRTGVYPLLVKMNQQAEEQLKTLNNTEAAK